MTHTEAFREEIALSIALAAWRRVIQARHGAMRMATYNAHYAALDAQRAHTVAL